MKKQDIPLILTDLVYHVDIDGIVKVKNWTFWWNGEEAHEHECTDQSVSLIPLLGEVDNSPVAQEDLLSILQQSDKSVLTSIR